jgi:hypothetical protein
VAESARPSYLFEAEIDQLTAEVEAARARLIRRCAPGIIVDAIGEVPR